MKRWLHVVEYLLPEIYSKFMSYFLSVYTIETFGAHLLRSHLEMSTHYFLYACCLL